MEESFMQQALNDYKEGLNHFQKQLPKVAKEYMRFTRACFAEGALSVKNKHLIGIALGCLTNDEYCIIYHTKEAVDKGASDKEVLEAAAVSGAFGGGVAMSQSVTLLQDALEEFRKDKDNQSTKTRRLQ